MPAGKRKYAFCGQKRLCICDSNAATASSSYLQIPSPTDGAIACGTGMWRKRFSSLIPHENVIIGNLKSVPMEMWIDLDISPGGLADLKSGISARWSSMKIAHLERGAGDPDKGTNLTLRPHRDLAGQFLSRGRGKGTASIFGVATDQFATAQFPCAQGVRENAVCGKRLGWLALLLRT